MHDDAVTDEPDDEPFDDEIDEYEESDDSEGTEIADVLDANVDVEDDHAAALLDEGDIAVLGRMPWSSNGTYLVTVTADGRRCQAIYKPEAGERPLWDFPGGLWRREVAASVVADELGWTIVPPTVERDGPLGVGSVQFFVPSRFEEHYFTFKDDPDHHDALHRICLFDLVTNNTDRKGGHILLSASAHLWGIDHGLSFHEEFKLRTVMWDYAGEPLDADHVVDLCRWLDTPTSARLADLLTPAEIEAMRDRTRRVVAGARYPHDPTGRRYPWPLV